jgi:hypothetical protein
MKTQHTPGPWTRNDKLANYNGTENHPQAIMAPGAQIIALLGEVDEKVANANLIANAPELLAALTDCVKLLRIYAASTEPSLNDQGSDAGIYWRANALVERLTGVNLMQQTTDPEWTESMNARKAKAIIEAMDEGRNSLDPHFTEFPAGDNHCKGICGPYNFTAKLFDEGSDYGIGKGRVSKLEIKLGSRRVVNYDRGWDINPEGDHLIAYDAIMILLEAAPKRFEDA